MAKNQNLEISIRILQNGHSIVECHKVLSRNLNIDITSDYAGDLAIPLYPLATDINLFYTEKGQFKINLDQPWSGFITSKGALVEISPDVRQTQTLSLSSGDYGSICFRDLTVLFKIQRKRKAKITKTSRSSEYQSSIFKQFFANTLETKSFFSAAAASLFVLALMVSVLANIDQKRPTKFEALESTFTLPFIDREHLRYSPEALQNNLNRTQYIANTIRYFRTISTLVMGFELDADRQLLQKSTVRHYQELYATMRESIKEKQEQKIKENQKRLEDKAVATIYIPSVMGEPIHRRLDRLVDKLDLIHQSMDMNLKAKRKISDAFQQDELYDWVNYHRKNNNRSYAANFLSKIKVFKGLSNEDHMYAVANNLATEAQNAQINLFGPLKKHKANNRAPIFISDTKQFTSFVNVVDLLSKSEKINQILASSFDKKRKAVIKEPLIGKINPKLISSAVQKKQFELQLCYDLALRRNQATKGTMEWQWRIDSRGRISDIILTESSIKDRHMVECVRRKMAMWKFPRPKRGSVKVNHSFYFSPQKG